MSVFVRLSYLSWACAEGGFPETWPEKSMVPGGPLMRWDNHKGMSIVYCSIWSQPLSLEGRFYSQEG